MIARKQHSIPLTTILVCALSVAAYASPGDLALRAKYHRTRAGSVQREGDDYPDLGPGASTTTPGMRWRGSTNRGSSTSLPFLGVAITPARALPPILASNPFHKSLVLSFHADLPLSVPGGRAPPSR